MAGDYRGSAAARPANSLQALRERRLGLVGLVEALARDALRQQLLGGDVAGMAVRVVVAAAVLSRARAGAQPAGDGAGAVLANVALGRRQRAPGGVGLRRERQVDRRLGERVARLRQADVLDRLRGGGRERQRRRVGVADVLGGEDHHPPHDEARVLAALEHHRQVVQRRVRVRAARGLDPGGDVVVVAVALFVVEDRPALQRVLDARERHALLAELRVRSRRASSSAFSAVRASPSLRAARNSSAPSSTGSASLAAGARRSTVADLLGRQRLQRVDAHAREQRAVDLERGVLGRRADQRHQALLDGRQQRVLLGLVEAVDLVEEEHRLRRRSVSRRCGGALDHGAHLGAPGRDRAQLLEGRAGALGDDPRERRLARAGRAVEDHRVRPALLDRGAQRRAGARADAPARRTPRGCAGASAPPAAVAPLRHSDYYVWPCRRPELCPNRRWIVVEKGIHRG